jgi:hypothetical protein
MASDLLERRPSICFGRWQYRIQTASDLDQLMEVVSTYLNSWTEEELALLPEELGARTLGGSVDLAERAVMASRAEINFSRHGKDYPYLREMALTLSAATSRLRYLQSLKTEF